MTCIDQSEESITDLHDDAGHDVLEGLLQLGQAENINQSEISIQVT